MGSLPAFLMAGADFVLEDGASNYADLVGSLKLNKKDLIGKSYEIGWLKAGREEKKSVEIMRQPI